MNHDNFNSEFDNDQDDGQHQLVENFDDSEFGQGDGDFVLPEGEEKKKKFSGGTILMIVVVVLAAGGLWSMRTLAIAMAGLPADADIEEIFKQIESLDTPNSALVIENELEQDTGSVLVNDRTEKQVPLQDVQRNPFSLFFEIEREEQSTGSVVTTRDAGPTIEEQRQEKIDVFESAAAKLRVLMIMGSGEPLANISGRVVRAGDTIFDDRLGVELAVTEITNGMVVVVGKDPELDLTHEMVLRLYR